jgi:hypothetical protein
LIRLHRKFSGTNGLSRRSLRNFGELPHREELAIGFVTEFVWRVRKA